MNKFMTRSGRLYHEIVSILGKANELAFVTLAELLEDSVRFKFPDDLFFKYAFMECALRNGLTLDEALKVRELGRELSSIKEEEHGYDY